MINPMKRQLLKLFGLAALSGCAQAQTKSRSVSIASFNYTGRAIIDIMVDGAWAGIADAYSSSGYAQGLLAPSDNSRVAVLTVVWGFSGLYDIEKNTYTRMPVEQHHVKVEVARPYPANPDYLVLHFYPDGHVEAELEADRPKRRIPTPPGYHR
jgi:hypothetical protein